MFSKWEFDSWKPASVLTAVLMMAMSMVCVTSCLSSKCETCTLYRSPSKVKLTGKQKKGFKSDWLGHAKREELDESALNTTKTSKVCKLCLLKRFCIQSTTHL